MNYIDQLNTTCLTTLGKDECWSLAAYLETGGYQSWEKVLSGELAIAEIIDVVKASGLRGRGGAGIWCVTPMRVSPAPVTTVTFCVLTRMR